MSEFKIEFNKNEEEDIDLLTYQLEEINEELVWQHQISEIAELNSRKDILEKKINHLKNNLK